MQHKILLVDDSLLIVKVLKHIAIRAGMVPVVAHCLKDAKALCESMDTSSDFYCAVVDYNLPDAAEGEAIDYVISQNIPTIVITGQVNNVIREKILQRQVVDYIPKENIQIYTYLRNLLSRLQRNHECGVLVVDDSRIVRKELVKLLQRHNFTTFFAETAEQANKLLKATSDIKIVLVDEHMPEKNGVNFVVDLRCDYSLDELVIIGISSKDDPALSARFIKSGANDYIALPFCHEEFFCRLYHNLERLEHIALIQEYANTDVLTKLFNRRYFFQTLETQPFDKDKTNGLALIDIDHFKTINDTYGHQTGDELLRRLGAVIKSYFCDQLNARVGGEEFCVFFSGVSESNFKDKLQGFVTQVASGVFPVLDREINITVSIGGVSGFGGDLNQYYQQADQCMYQAKHQGRNKVIIKHYR